MKNIAFHYPPTQVERERYREYPEFVAALMPEWRARYLAHYHDLDISDNELTGITQRYQSAYRAFLRKHGVWRG